MTHSKRAHHKACSFAVCPRRAYPSGLETLAFSLSVAKAPVRVTIAHRVRKNASVYTRGFFFAEAPRSGNGKPTRHQRTHAFSVRFSLVFYRERRRTRRVRKNTSVYTRVFFFAEAPRSGNGKPPRHQRTHAECVRSLPRLHKKTGRTSARRLSSHFR